jgi:hypothetical protein
MVKERTMAKRTKDDQGGNRLRVFPHQLLRGDLYRHAESVEWTVVHAPTTYRDGKRMSVKFRRPGDPTAEPARDWAPHEKVAVRRVL